MTSPDAKIFNILPTSNLMMVLVAIIDTEIPFDIEYAFCFLF